MLAKSYTSAAARASQMDLFKNAYAWLSRSPPRPLAMNGSIRSVASQRESVGDATVAVGLEEHIASSFASCSAG